MVKIFNRAKETTTATGTGDLALAGAATGYQAWSARYKHGDTFPYCCAGQGTAEWEAGIGWYNATTNAVSRQTVLESSNSDTLVSFSAGTKDIFVGQPTELNLIQKSSGAVSAGQLVQQTSDGVQGYDTAQLQDFMKMLTKYMQEAGIPFGQQAVYGKAANWMTLLKMLNPAIEATADTYARALPGRISLSSTLAVPTSDILAATTLYWQLVPGQGAVHQLFDGQRYRPRVLNNTQPLQLSLAGLVSGKNYDIVMQSTGGNGAQLALGPAWTGDNTRSLAINQDSEGTYYLGGDRRSIVVGTIRGSAAGQCEDSEGGVTTQVGGNRLVSNLYNPVPRFITVIDTTDSWNYSTNSFRQSNGNAGNQVSFVRCLDIYPVQAVSHGGCSASVSTVPTAGIGVDSTTVNSGKIYAGGAGTTGVQPAIARYNSNLSLGFHQLMWLEKGWTSGTVTWYGDATSQIETGLTAMIMG